MGRLRLSTSIGVIAATFALGCGGSSAGGAGDAGRDGALPADGSPAATDAAPDAPVTTVSSITRDGVTWTFAAPVLAGQFVTGDPWVVGPVTVTAISPAPETAAPFKNGSVVHADGTPFSAGLYGPYEQLQPRDWPLRGGNEQLGEAYRRCCTSLVWVPQALAMRLMHAESAWSYPAWFDYVDRWMFEDDTQAVADILAQSGYEYSSSWERQRQTAGYYQGGFPQYTFVDDMWAQYRPAP
jgi:hypothetical protein